MDFLGKTRAMCETVFRPVSRRVGFRHHLLFAPKPVCSYARRPATRRRRQHPDQRRGRPLPLHSRVRRDLEAARSRCASRTCPRVSVPASAGTTPDRRQDLQHRLRKPLGDGDPGRDRRADVGVGNNVDVAVEPTGDPRSLPRLLGRCSAASSDLQQAHAIHWRTGRVRTRGRLQGRSPAELALGDPRYFNIR